MQIIDLTYTICQNMPVYPGTQPPRLQCTASYETDGFRETLLQLFSHTGTHMDAPAHLFAQRTTLDALHVSQFVGSALVIDCSDAARDSTIGMQYLEPALAEAEAVDFLLFYTGTGKYWGQEAYFGAYPVLSDQVVQFLIDTGKKGVGLDTMGIDPMADVQLTRHRTLLAEHDIVILENLANLELIGPQRFTFAALPLKFENADGAPVRAIAMLQEE